MSSTSKQAQLMAFGLADGLAKRVANDTVGSGLVATGTVIGDALQLANQTNHITTSSASTGVKLPDWPVGARLWIDNASGVTLNIFPHSASGTITGGSDPGAGAAQTIVTAKMALLYKRTLTDWRYLLIN